MGEAGSRWWDMTKVGRGILRLLEPREGEGLLPFAFSFFQPMCVFYLSAPRRPQAGTLTGQARGRGPEA